jgi:AcrR family transcriptional regulator
MNTKNNQRTRLSKMLFKNALMDLLKEKGSINKVSVRELCDRAELNRSTFYAHYQEPNDLLIEIETELLDATEEHLKKIGAENEIGAHKYILSFLQYIRQNDKPFRALLIDSTDPEFRSRFMQQSIIQFVENLRIVLPKELEQYIFSYILNGSTGIIIQWIRSDYAADENEIVNLLFSINNSALVNLNLETDI